MEKQEGQSAKMEFAGRVIWTVDGMPIDGRKPAALGECCVLGCSNPSATPSAFCVERHRGDRGVE